MTFDDYLTILAKNDGSDLFLSTGAPPCAKFHGKLTPLSKEPFLPGEIKSIAYAMMDSGQLIEFEQELEMNLAHHIPRMAASG
jgi:twitching motility protein PilU